MEFSKRYGYKSIAEGVQTESMDETLRNSIWDLVFVFWIHYLAKTRGPSYDWQVKEAELLGRLFWTQYLKQRWDEYPGTYHFAEVFKQWFLQCEWYEVYDVLEFVARNASKIGATEFCSTSNTVLERERSGYRFVGHNITPISSETEVASIEETLAVTDRFDGVRSHISSALSKLSDRKKPDYRNSVKESISAVESLMRQVTEERTAKFSDSLAKVTRRFGLHPALRGAFGKLYGYTSDAEGIRHSMLNESKIDYAEAKFMLIACSAFINYVLTKSADSEAIEESAD